MMVAAEKSLWSWLTPRRLHIGISKTSKKSVECVELGLGLCEDHIVAKFSVRFCTLDFMPICGWQNGSSIDHSKSYATNWCKHLWTWKIYTIILLKMLQTVNNNTFVLVVHCFCQSSLLSNTMKVSRQNVQLIQYYSFFLLSSKMNSPLIFVFKHLNAFLWLNALT